MVRCLLFHSSKPLDFWAEALNTACYILNRIPSNAVNGKIPWELWTGKELDKRDYSILRVFGCQAWAMTDETKKLGARAEECVFLGYPEGIKGYRLWSLKDKRVIVTRDVIFHEDAFPFKNQNCADPSTASFAYCLHFGERQTRDVTENNTEVQRDVCE